jgi:hypothetical protein
VFEVSGADLIPRIVLGCVMLWPDDALCDYASRDAHPTRRRHSRLVPKFLWRFDRPRPGDDEDPAQWVQSQSVLDREVAQTNVQTS